MRYWDTSALVALVVQQLWSERAHQYHRSDRDVVTSWLSSIECSSALWRLLRLGELGPEEFAITQATLAALRDTLDELALAEGVRDIALRLVTEHPLRAADALHLASALQWCGEAPEGHEFVTFDRRLAEAARREGFVVLTEGEGTG
ncbi:MAG: type II toxin-antitoxin system VapC family toxin [Armatimonadetes bacterium]|nr:type II toxin-antitoxin system VapC family toxin [Armatimonadota bacterium]